MREYFLFRGIVGKEVDPSLYPAASIFLIPFVLSQYNLGISKSMYFQFLLKETLYCFFHLSSLSLLCQKSKTEYLLQLYDMLEILYKICVKQGKIV